MSIFPSDSIKIIAESVGINKIDDDVASELAADVEYRLRAILKVSLLFISDVPRKHLNLKNTTKEMSSQLQIFLRPFVS